MTETLMVGRSLCPIIFSSFCLLPLSLSCSCYQDARPRGSRLGAALLSLPLATRCGPRASSRCGPRASPLCASRPASPPATSRPGLPALGFIIGCPTHHGAACPAALSSACPAPAWSTLRCASGLGRGWCLPPAGHGHRPLPTSAAHPPVLADDQRRAAAGGPACTARDSLAALSPFPLPSCFDRCVPVGVYCHGFADFFFLLSPLLFRSG